VRKNRLNKLAKDEKGQTLIIVVLLMLASALVIAPMLSHVGSGLKSGREVFEEKVYGQYAADSGVEDALYKIQTDYPDLPDQWDGSWVTDDAYETSYGPYVLSDINGNDVSVTIQPQWILQDLEDPPNGMTPHADMVVVGDTIGEEDGNGLYQISINITEAEKTLHVERVGAWLPSGYTYVSTSSNLENDPYDWGPPTVTPHRGGSAIVWDFGEPRPKFEELPGTDLKKVVTFQFMPQGRPASAFSWVKIQSADVDLSWDVDLKYYQITSIATDIGTDKIITVEAYAAENELRKLGTAVTGDYFAVGNSLIGGSGHPPDNYHYQLYNSTQASISTSSDPSSGTPADATIQAAYLYWTGWIDWHGYEPEEIFYDDCSNFDSPPVSWAASGSWEIYNYIRFSGRGGEHDLTSGTIPLGDYSGRCITVSLYISDYRAEDGDYLYCQFYKNGGWSDRQTIFEGDDPAGTYSVTIPDDYLTSNFRMRFTVDCNNSSEYVYLDNITIAAGGLRYPSNPTAGQIASLVEETARVNKVLFNDTPVTADAYQALYPEAFVGDDTFGGTWFYTAMADVTDLLDQWIDNETIGSNGAGSYTVGHYYVGDNEEDPDYYFDFYSGTGGTGYPLGTPSPSSNPSSSRYTAAHCGWSLLVLYSSPETEGHQLYLYDIQSPNFDFFFGWKNNADFDNDGDPGGTISGFLVPEPITGETLAGRITVFVGEGDAGYTDDYFRVNGSNMSNSASPAYNVWNSASPGLTVAGVDIDPFDITWASGILSPGDASVQIDIPTGTPPQDTDGFTMVYVILSFRSEITSGGTISYLIRG